MAWTVNLLTNMADDGTSEQTHTCASFTPTTGFEMVVSVYTQADGEATAFDPGLTDSGGRTWTLRAQPTDQDGGFPAFHTRQFVYTAPVGTGGSGTTVTFDPWVAGGAASDLSYVSMVVFEIKPSGTAAFVQAAVNSQDGEASMTATFSSAPTSGNLVVGLPAAYRDTSGAFGAMSGFSSLSNPTAAFDACAAFYRSDTTSTTVVTLADYGNNVFTSAISGLEFSGDAGAASSPPNFRRRRSGLWVPHAAQRNP
jgi:hypothetical protein